MSTELRKNSSLLFSKGSVVVNSSKPSRSSEMLKNNFSKPHFFKKMKGEIAIGYEATRYEAVLSLSDSTNCLYGCFVEPYNTKKRGMPLLFVFCVMFFMHLIYDDECVWVLQVLNAWLCVFRSRYSYLRNNTPVRYLRKRGCVCRYGRGTSGRD